MALVRMQTKKYGMSRAVFELDCFKVAFSGLVTVMPTLLWENELEFGIWSSHDNGREKFNFLAQAISTRTLPKMSMQGLFLLVSCYKGQHM